MKIIILICEVPWLNMFIYACLRKLSTVVHSLLIAYRIDYLISMKTKKSCLNMLFFACVRINSLFLLLLTFSVS